MMTSSVLKAAISKTPKKMTNFRLSNHAQTPPPRFPPRLPRALIGSHPIFIAQLIRGGGGGAQNVKAEFWRDIL